MFYANEHEPVHVHGKAAEYFTENREAGSQNKEGVWGRVGMTIKVDVGTLCSSRMFMGNGDIHE